MHSTDPIATPKWQNAYEKDFVHSHTAKKFANLCNRAFERIIRILRLIAVNVLGKVCDELFQADKHRLTATHCSLSL